MRKQAEVRTPGWEVERLDLYPTPPALGLSELQCEDRAEGLGPVVIITGSQGL